MTVSLTPVLLGLFASCSPSAQEPAPVAPHAFTNHLAGETSPYLLQHAHNPVDWYPWGAEALERAKQEDKPIFLSIGYSACHWCHVMERESFENEEIAALLNQSFICIKVDREERPDLDDIYMSAVQKLTGSGGWPLSVWLTPDLHPFYGGTYFPPEDRYGRPGFAKILNFLADAWQNRRQEIEQAAVSLSATLGQSFPALKSETEGLDASQLAHLQSEWVQALAATYDASNGGFGQAPKFPHAEDLRFLLAAAVRLHGTESASKAQEMALFSLRKMASGGMYDRLGGGFARYSVDAAWLIPHFEKMLYDQGTLIPAYLEAYRLSQDSAFADIARQSCDYLLREMRDPEGAFYSSTDADSEGEEGKFFVWTPDQLREVLGEPEAAFAAELFGVTEKGNFEHGASVLRAATTPIMAARHTGIPEQRASALAEEVRATLFAARSQRVPPATDDKVLTAWNGLAIDALAMAGRQLGEPRYTQAAATAAQFLLDHMRLEDGRLQRAWRHGKSQHAAVLEDYAYLIQGLLSLFMSTGEESWLLTAENLAQHMLEDFWDDSSGVFFNTDGRDPHLLQRLQQPWDGATPSANGIALKDLLILHAFTQDEAWGAPARRGMQAVQELAVRNPRSFTTTLRSYAWVVEEPAVAVVVGTGAADSLEAWRRVLVQESQYFDTLLVLSPHAKPNSDCSLFHGRTAVDGKPTLYLCKGQSCQLPRTSPVE